MKISNFREATIGTALIGVLMVGLYGCGDTPPASAPTTAPTSTTVAVEPTEAMAGPTSTIVMATADSTSTTASTGSNDDSTVPADVKALFGKSEQAMRGVKSFHFSTKSETAGTTMLSEADMEPPDKARIVSDAGAAGKSEIIVIGKESFMKVPGGDTYIALPQSLPISASDTSSFLTFAQDAKIVGDEKIEGVDTTHIQFSYDADKSAADAAAQAGQPAPTTKMGTANADLYVEKTTGYIRQFKYATKVEGVGDSTVTITYSKFNEPISPPIEKPSNVTTMPGAQP